MIFLGKQDQVQEKLAISDVMLLPSELESFGLAALEAMACEVVPIATRVGGLPEVIEHGKSGFLADVGDVDTMAQYAIDLLSDDKQARSRWAKQARGVGAGALLLQQDHSALRRLLPARAGAFFVERGGMPEPSCKIGSRNRTSVPLPSWLSMVIRAVSP